MSMGDIGDGCEAAVMVRLGIEIVGLLCYAGIFRRAIIVKTQVRLFVNR